MGIFTRFKDIVSANLNSMLDKAEDPEKLIRLMIREMEETLVELKAACAGNMAGVARIRRELAAVKDRVDTWEARARLAADKGRDDLAREALVEKRRLAEEAERLAEELARAEALVAQAQEDIGTLDAKLSAARDKQRLLIARHHRAQERKRARGDLAKADSSETFLRFSRFEQQVERMEAEAEMAGPAGGTGLEEAFRRLEGDEDVERELAELKAARAEARK